MKKNNIIKIIFTLVAVILLSNINIKLVNAQDDGYYIKDMNVDVMVNDKREYIITETIDAYFNEDRHGIIRKIPKISSLEEYKITNVSVNGAPYEIEDYGDLNIKIGDPENTLTGDKRYVIKYTIESYSDEQSEGDYIYLNVLGEEWDTKIEKFTSTITYPKEAELKSLTITDGAYGSTKNSYVTYNSEGNKVTIKSKHSIDPYCGVTANIMLNEGALKNAPIKKYPYTVNSDVSNIEITKEKEYLIERRFDIQVNDYDEEYYSNYLYLWRSHSSRDYIKDITVDNNEIIINEEEGKISFPKEPGKYNFTVTYKIEPTLKSPIEFPICNYYRDGKTEYININFTSKIPIKTIKMDFREKGVNAGTTRYDIKRTTNGFTFTTLNSVNVGEEIVINLRMDETLFSRPLPPMANFIYYISVGLFLIVCILYLKFKDKNPFISAVEFYPPSNMNSAEVSYAYNKYVSPKDITSLIFYWASQNHIKITMLKKERYRLTLIEELDDNHPDYEKELFKALFSAGDGTIVKSEELKGTILKEINEACKKVRKLFTKDRELSDKKSKKIPYLILMILSIPILLVCILSAKINHYSMMGSIGLAVVIMIILLIFYGVIYGINSERYTTKDKSKAIKGNILVGVFYIVICFSVAGFSDVPVSILTVVAILSLASMIVVSKIPKRTKYGKEVLERIIGFKIFLETAEKDRLEALLEEDPEYFYNTLPYAQVLGVTKKWADKFKDITIAPPSYFEGHYSNYDVYTMLYYINTIEKINNNILSHNDSSNDSGGSGGGFTGGGFSGGGFSGGGSGGGGGSSW